MGCDGEIDDMLRIRVHEAGSVEEIFTSMVWIRAFNTSEPIYAKLCHEFYSTYEFNKVCAGDELQSKKNIRFRLGGRAHNLTLLEFAQRLGLYQKTPRYDKIQKNDLWLLSMFDARHQNGHENVAWFISKLARKCRVLTDDVVRSLSALIYCRDLDTTTLIDLIDSDSKLILEDPQPSVPRVRIPRPP
uniref:Retrotransposon Orf1 n=1 Tax=Tanacetum cinerariifolium TaxID=118510 RepID=A0A699ICR6_TANCI|nr:retrotransposon Orf1 [Tanacetum cinerariifolium]